MFISNDQGEIFKKVVNLAFPCSNNQAEYEALAIGLDLAKEMKFLSLRFVKTPILLSNKSVEILQLKEPNLTKYKES